MPVLRTMETVDLDTLTPAQRKHFRKLKKEQDKKRDEYMVAEARFTELKPIYSMLRVMCPLTHLGAVAKAEEILSGLKKLAPKRSKGMDAYAYVSAYAGVDPYKKAAEKIFPAEKSVKAKRRVGKKPPKKT
jgi:hypothetical protein